MSTTDKADPPWMFYMSRDSNAAQDMDGAVKKLTPLIFYKAMNDYIPCEEYAWDIAQEFAEQAIKLAIDLINYSDPDNAWKIMEKVRAENCPERIEADESLSPIEALFA